MDYIEMLQNFRAFTYSSLAAVAAYDRLIHYQKDGIMGIRPLLVEQCFPGVIPHTDASSTAQTNNTSFQYSSVRIKIPLRFEMSHIFSNFGKDIALRNLDYPASFVTIFIRQHVSSGTRNLILSWNGDGITNEKLTSPIISESLFDLTLSANSKSSSGKLVHLLLALFAGTDKWTLSGARMAPEDRSIVNGLHRVQQLLRDRTVPASDISDIPAWTPKFSERQFLWGMALAKKELYGEHESSGAVFYRNIEQTRNMLRVADDIIHALNGSVDKYGPIYCYSTGNFHAPIIFSISENRNPFMPWYINDVESRVHDFDYALSMYPQLDSFPTLNPQYKSRGVAYSGFFSVMELLYKWYSENNAKFPMSRWQDTHVCNEPILNGKYMSDLAQIISFAETVPNIYPAEFLIGAC